MNTNTANQIVATAPPASIRTPSLYVFRHIIIGIAIGAALMYAYSVLGFKWSVIVLAAIFIAYAVIYIRALLSFKLDFELKDESVKL